MIKFLDRLHPFRVAYKDSVLFLVGVCCVFVSFMFLWNSKIFYEPIGLIDPYTNIGIGLYFGNPQFWDWYYKISRAPWVLMEFVGRHVFSTEFAGPILQLSCYIIASLSAFAFASTLFKKATAVIFGLLVVLLPLFRGEATAGADYSNTITGSLQLLSFAAMVVAIRRDSTLLSLAFGAAVASAVHTNPIVILTAPLLISLGLAVCFAEGRKPSRIAVYLGAMLAGFALTTLAFSLVYVMFGRSGLFFMPQVNVLLWNVQLPTASDNPWWVAPDWSWIKESAANAVMFAMFVISLVEAVRITLKREFSDRAIYMSIFVGYAATYIVAVILQMRGLTTLHPDYLGYVFTIAAMLPLVALLDQGAALPGPALMAFLPIVIVSALLAYAGIAEAIAPFWAAIIASTAIYLSTWYPIGGIGTVVLIACFSAGTMENSEYYVHDPCQSDRHLTEVLVSASQLGSEFVSDPSKLRIWYDRSETLSVPCYNMESEAIGVSFASIAHSYLGRPFPLTALNDLSRTDFERATDGAIALVTFNNSADPLINRAHELGYRLAVRGIYFDRRTTVKFYFLTFELA